MSQKVMIGLTLTLLATAAVAQTGSLYQQAQAEARQVEATQKTGDAEGAPVQSLTAPSQANPRTFTKEQLVTIVVQETAQHATNGNTSLSRESSIDAKVDAWVRFHGGMHNMIQPVGFEKGEPEVKADGERDFEGSGSTARTDVLTARITGRIIDIRPNGNLVIEASKKITTDEESYTITVTGVCRTADVTPDNTVLSSQVAELDIVKTSTGAVRKATERGFLQKLADLINIF